MSHFWHEHFLWCHFCDVITRDRSIPKFQQIPMLEFSCQPIIFNSWMCREPLYHMYTSYTILKITCHLLSAKKTYKQNFSFVFLFFTQIIFNSWMCREPLFHMYTSYMSLKFTCHLLSVKKNYEQHFSLVFPFFTPVYHWLKWLNLNKKKYIVV